MDGEHPLIEHLEGNEISPIPLPFEALQGTPIPPFLSKTFDIVDDAALDPIISWGPTGESFIVWDPMEFSRTVLPRHFKHNNFSSFVRQLNTYGFRKIGTDRWEFANDDFQRRKRALLKHINRRRSSQAHQICTQVGSSGEMGKAVVECEVQKLKREKDLMMQEVMQLRKEHLMTVKKMDSLNHRMQTAELRKKQMVSFLAKMLQNPTFVGHLKQLKGQREIASMRGKRKFIKHHRQQQPIFTASAVPVNQQGVLFKDIADKFDLDTGGGEIYGESEVLKGKNILSPQMESEFPGSDYFVSLPNDIANLETEYISQEVMFPDSISPANYCVSTGEWNIGLEIQESLLSSEPAVWDDSLSREMETAVGSCSLWDLGLNTLEEDLDIANYMRGLSEVPS